MPKINNYKIVNFRYGKPEPNRMLSEKTINAEGNHLQFEATNSMGKSMSIQTLIQAICPLADVDKKFIEIYTVREPVYVLIEWILDDNRTKLLTGIGFERKNQTNFENEKGNSKQDLYRFFTYVIEENDYLNMNIDNIEFYDYSGKNKKLKSLVAMEEYIKNLKSGFSQNVYTYSQYSSSQKKYKEKLREYGISQSEWRDIIIKLNTGETQLGNFLDKLSTSEKLIRDKIIPLMDSNLNRNSEDGLQIQKYRNHVKSFIKKCIELNESLENYDEYTFLLEIINDMQENARKQLEISRNIHNKKDELTFIYNFAANKIEILNKELEDINNEILLIESEKNNYNLKRIVTHSILK